MSVTTAQLDHFHAFALERVGNGGVNSLEELVAMWQAEAASSEELRESLQALNEGLEDAEAGRFRPASEVFQDLAKRYDADLSQ